MVGSDALTDAGYEVIEAETADQALRILESGGDVHVLFTDIRMPGSMDGLSLAALVHDRWPAVRILITSGDTWPPKGAIPDNGYFLSKPYQVQTLRDNIARLVDN